MNGTLGIGVVKPIALLVGMWATVFPAWAHVTLLAPNGGEVLEVGSTFTVRWQINIAHNLLNWDLWYSTTGAGGPWIEIAMDLPPGSGSAGSIHTYDWTVPNAVSDQVRVRVRMDNSGLDYYDISNSDLSIVSPPPSLPSSFTIIRGLLISGGLPDLFDSDDSRLVVRTAVFAPSIEPPVQIEVVGTSPTETPSELRFRFEGMASRNLIERRISLYNYVTQSYEELHVAFAATSDEVVEIVVTSNASRFVEPGTGQVKSLMTWKAAAFSFFTGWNVGTDQTIWRISP